MKYKHYAPNAHMTIFRGSPQNMSKAIEQAKQEAEAHGKRVGIIKYDEDDHKTAARTLYAKLREFDEEGVDEILATAITTSGEGFAVMNRMMKAANHNVIDV